VWAAVSDRVGRPAVFALFTAGSIPLYLSVPTLVNLTASSGEIPLYVFIAGTATAISFMGGAFAIMPAYEADIFGSKYVGPIHGRMLLYSSFAGLAGPSLILSLRGMAEGNAIRDLLTKASMCSLQI